MTEWEPPLLLALPFLLLAWARVSPGAGEGGHQASDLSPLRAAARRPAGIRGGDGLGPQLRRVRK